MCLSIDNHETTSFPQCDELLNHKEDMYVTTSIRKSPLPVTYASAEEWDTICCFLVFHKIGEKSSNTNHFVKEQRVMRQPAQSESHQPDKLNSQSERRNIPCTGPSSTLDNEQLLM